ncbi:hypothetical protein QTP88_028825 [Uroleucon formosanum]
MNKEKVLLENLITSKKNIKRKIMEMKRDVIDSENYFREAFKPIIEPLSTHKKQNEIYNTQSTELENKSETSYTREEDDDNKLNSPFEFFLNNRPKSTRYDKSYGMHYDKNSDSYKIGKHSVTFSHGKLLLLNKYYQFTSGLWSLLCEKEPKNTTIEDIESYYNILKTFGVHLKADGNPITSRYHKWMNVVKPLYDRMKMEEKQFNEEITKINETKTPRINLKTFNNTLPSTPFKLFNAKRRKITQENEPFDFNQSASSFSPTDRMSTDMINFTSSPDPKKGSGLYKDVLPQTQLVYYDDPNELVTRLNLFVSSQIVGNTGVNNEIISILEELYTYTKYVFAEPLKNKSGKECTKGMFNILKKANPKFLQTDYGTSNWYNTISKIIQNYNNTKHRTIKCTPNEARMDTNRIKFNTCINSETLYKPKFKVNDKVRKSKYKHIFSKGYTPNWTTEIFTVSKVLQTNPATYQLKDGSDNIILGGFYEQEIKLTNFPDTSSLNIL